MTLLGRTSQQMFQKENKMDINQVLQFNYVKDLIAQTCGDETELVSRRDCYAVRSKVEEERDVHRVLLMPPRGFTANELDQMNSHDEADFATIEIKGAVKEGKFAFSKLKDCLLVASKDENGSVSELTHPYLTFDLEEDREQTGLTLIKHSAGLMPFAVVKNDGFGFYHNLINMTDEWLVLKLHKRLRPQRVVNLDPILETLDWQSADQLNKFYSSIVKYGDSIYSKDSQVIDMIVSMSIKETLPALIEMLYVHDSGMHEACTVFGMILKIGKTHPEIVTKYLQQALDQEDAVPPYYAEQLMAKIGKKAKVAEHKAVKKAA